MRQFIRVAAACGVALCGAGCSSGGPPSNTTGLENLQPVTGRVSFKGQPTPGAIVMFFSATPGDAGPSRIAGEVKDDGTFSMRSTVSAGTKPGVPEGSYHATITWNKMIDKDNEGPDLLPEKYKKRSTSGLKVEVKPGKNDLAPFDLTE